MNMSFRMFCSLLVRIVKQKMIAAAIGTMSRSPVKVREPMIMLHIIYMATRGLGTSFLLFEDGEEGDVGGGKGIKKNHVERSE